MSLILLVVRTWQCFACSTWNADQQNVCDVCEYDRRGRPVHALGVPCMTPRFTHTRSTT